MKNFYEIIGTNYEVIQKKVKENADIEIDNFLKEKYEYVIKLINTKLSIATSEERIEELKKQKNEIIYAYNHIKTPIQREIYNKTLEQEKFQKILDKDGNLNYIAKEKTAYSILNILPETLKARKNEEIDKIIESKKVQLLERYEEWLEKSKNFNDNTKIKTEIGKINEAYELIKTAEKRESYKLQLQQELDEEEEKNRQRQIKNKYEHKYEFNLGLIEDNRSKETLQSGKMIKRNSVDSSEYFYMDKENRNLRIKQTGKIIYKNWQGIITSIDEYLVSRTINGLEKSDIVYTDISFINLSKDKKSEKLLDYDYYNCVVNKLLSEETIDGAKYNYGYIGEIEKGKDGKYDITLKNRKLKEREKERLTAVMIIKNLEKEKIMEER